MVMEHLPIPNLYRLTNNQFVPKINTLWIGDNGNVVRISNIFSPKKPVIICYKHIESTYKDGDIEFSISLHKFHSMFYSFEN